MNGDGGFAACNCGENVGPMVLGPRAGVGLMPNELNVLEMVMGGLPLAANEFGGVTGNTTQEGSREECGCGRRPYCSGHRPGGH